MLENLESDKEGLKEIKKMIKEIALAYEDIGKRAKARGLELTDAIKASRKELSYYAEEIKSVKGSLETNLGGALHDFATQAKSAKEAFSDFAEGFVNDIGRMLTRAIAMQTVQAMVGGIGMMFGEGGIMPGHFTPITPMQHGGLYSRPTLGLIAEAGTPEAVVPLKRGGIPVEFKDKREKRERPTYIVNAFSEEFMQQQVNKALAQNAEVVLNIVQQDIASQGNTYQLVRGLR